MACCRNGANPFDRTARLHHFCQPAAALFPGADRLRRDAGRSSDLRQAGAGVTKSDRAAGSVAVRHGQDHRHVAREHCARSRPLARRHRSLSGYVGGREPLWRRARFGADCGGHVALAPEEDPAARRRQRIQTAATHRAAAAQKRFRWRLQKPRPPAVNGFRPGTVRRQNGNGAS